MCEARDFKEIKTNVIFLQEEYKQVKNNWKNHFDWLKSLNTDKGPIQEGIPKYIQIFEKVKIFIHSNFRSLKEKFIVKFNLSNQKSRIFLKNYYLSREDKIRKRVDNLESKFNKKLEKKHKKLVMFREKRFQEMINLGEEI